MKKSFFKRGASALLAVVMCLSTFLGIGSTTAFAAENTTDEVVMFSFPREGDSNFGGDWGHGELKYMNGWSAASTKKITVYTIGSWTGNACYCIEPGTPLNIGDVMTKRDENYWDNYPSAYNKTISADEIKLFIGRIFQYGYTGKVDIDWRSQNSADADKMAHIMATQTLIWETVVGERDSNFNHVDTGSYDAVNDRVSKSHPLYSQYISYYNSMVSNVQKHSKVPSFFAKSTSKAQDIELEWNGTNYSTTLTDTNNVLGNYSFTASESGINFSVSGNKLTITATKAPTSKVNITATKNGSVRKGVVVWSDGKYAPGSGIQDLSTFAAEVNDPVRGYLNIKVSLGSAKIVKTSEDGNVSGISFTITGNGVNKTVKTGSNGEIVIDNLSPGTYTVTEQSIGYYEPQQSKTVTVVSGQTASVSFKNVLKRSDLKVIKTSEDNMNEGVKFHLYGKSTSGQTVDLFATTDKNGVAMFKNVLVGTNYTLEEVETAERYIIPDSQVAVIEWEKVTENDFYNELKRGDLKVVKTSEDNMVEGIKFHLYGTSLSGHKVDEYAVTDKNGVAMFEDVLIGSRYTLEEVNTAEKYIVPKAQTVEIEWNKVVNKSFDNILKRGDLKVVKTAEDKLVEGLKFHLYGTSLSGIKVDEYATTDKNGVATFKNILIGSNFTIEEVNTPIRYVIPESQSAVIEWNKVTEKSFENILKKWRADVYKLDSELADKNGGSGVPVKLVDGDSDEMIEKLGGAYGKTQGDATLGGAVYGVYKGETLVDTYTTDENGYFITDYYVCGDDWSIREITPSEGYLLDTTIYHIDCSAENYTVELNTEYPDVYENIIKGNIAIIKHTDDGSTKIETPEEGAKFEIFLKAAGSYKNAKETERDVIICDEHGFGQTKMLPYGVYTVHQVSGWDGRELMPDFEVYIAQHETTYRYLINNANFESYVRVVKVDAETEKTIPYAGAAFKIYNPDGELVKMTFTYPTPTTIDTFYTDANGSLVTPEKLPYGKGYYLVEVEAPFGYVLDTTPVYFDVTEDNSTEESGITVIKVNKANMAQKGTVTVEKNGEVFFGVDVSGDEDTVIYQPIYKDAALEGAVFEIRAAEDIYTPDGTLRYAKGEVVDTITTGADGLAKSKEIYLGKYEVQEIKAPYGYVISKDIHSVELIYAGQNISVTETATSFYNERQKATLSMQKVLETNDLFEIGNNGEIKNVVFGLYAAEELVSTSGTSIPADGLIEVIIFDENGLATVIYKVVYPLLSSNDVSSGAKSIRMAIKEKFGAEKIKYIDDAEAEDENGYEILVGRTTREASEAALNRLKENRVNCSQDFIVKVIGNQICINAVTDEMVGIAAKWFVETFCQSERSWSKLKKNYEFIYAPQFSKAEETEGMQYTNLVNEVDLGTYGVVIPTSSTLISSYAAEEIKNYYKQNGYGVEFYREKEKENKYEILIGDCDRPESNSVEADGDNYVIKVVGTKIVVKGGNDLSTRTAGEYLLNEIKKADDGKAFNWSDGYTVNGKYDATSNNEYRLTWGDEFSGTKLDATQWSRYPGYSFKEGSSSLGGTLYSYTTDYADAENLAALEGVTYKKPIFVSDGSLIMTAQRISDKDFLGTRISSYATMVYRYGYTEIRSQLAPSPAHAGFWVNGGKLDSTEAIKRFGNEITRNCMTEIDLVENFGATHGWSSNVHVWWQEYDKNGNASNLGHTSLDGNSEYSGSSLNNKAYKHTELLSDDYHVYSCYWDEDCMQFAFDGKIYLDYQYKDNQSTSIHCLMNYFIISVGIGNPSYGWGYKKDEHPDYFETKVDYVRIYQNPATKAQMIKAWPEYQEEGTRTIVFPEVPVTLY